MKPLFKFLGWIIMIVIMFVINPILGFIGIAWWILASVLNAKEEKEKDKVKQEEKLRLAEEKRLEEQDELARERHEELMEAEKQRIGLLKEMKDSIDYNSIESINARIEKESIDSWASKK